MAYEDVGYSILEALRLLGIAANIGVTEPNHKIRELPKNDQELPTDSLPCVIYTPAQGISTGAMTTENDSDVTYTVEVCLVVGHEGDFASHQKVTQAMHKKLLRAMEKNEFGEFRTSLSGVPSVWSVEIEHAPNFDRSLLNNNYAYLSVVVKLRSVE